MQSVREIIDVLRGLDIQTIVDDTRNITQNSAFFCNEKAREMGYDMQAVKLGAKAVILIDSKIDALPYIGVESWEVFVNVLKEFYGERSAKLFAITGTNGKTSTVHFGASLCSLMSVKSATIGTSGICIYENGVVVSQKKTGLTTPTCVQNHLAIYKLQMAGERFIFVEASSI
jgi:UDP-N-acetylmuramyl tripeptide synthase